MPEDSTTDSDLHRELRRVLHPVGGRRLARAEAATGLRYGVLAVCSGVKPAYLYDHGSISASALAHATALCGTDGCTASKTPSPPPTSGGLTTGAASSTLPLVILELVEASPVDGDDGWESVRASSGGATPASDLNVVALFVLAPATLVPLLTAFVDSVSHACGTRGVGSGPASAARAIASRTTVEVDDGGAADGSEPRAGAPTAAVLLHVGDAHPRLATVGESTRVRTAVETLLRAIHTSLSSTSPAVQGLGRAPIVRVTVDDGWPMAALVGIILGYPVVYNTGPQGTNCLSAQDLRLWQHRCTCVVPGSSLPPNHCITAFTHPSSFDGPGIISDAVQSWRDRATLSTTNCAGLTDVSIKVTAVNFPSVSL
jgi:hypothetical protein